MCRLIIVGEGRKWCLMGILRDDFGVIELVWFFGIYWIEKFLVVGKEYVVYGCINYFNYKFNIVYLEIEVVSFSNMK